MIKTLTCNEQLENLSLLPLKLPELDQLFSRSFLETAGSPTPHNKEGGSPIPVWVLVYFQTASQHSSIDLFCFDAWILDKKLQFKLSLSACCLSDPQRPYRMSL